MDNFESKYIEARRKLIASEFQNLNPAQLEAVMTTEGPLLLLAGAGSGKTTVLISRIANLLRYGRASDSTEIPPGVGEAELRLLEAAATDPNHPELNRARGFAALDPVEPWRILAITFTNKAANEMKSRLYRLLGEGSERIWAMTFHAACVRILRADCDRLGFTPEFSIYDSSDSQSLIRRIIKEMNLDEKNFPYRSVLSTISAAKNEGQSAQSYLDSAMGTNEIRRQRIAQCFVEYAKRLREANAMDFDDLIYFAVELLRENPDVREKYQRRFRYVLVDEYQDTNRLQYELTTILAAGHENICVVGDDDQSIYKFRGATIENILGFEKSYRHSRVIRLEQNYRSTGHILAAANSVIANNTERRGKNLWTDQGEGNPVYIYSAFDQNDEAEYIAARVLKNREEGAAWSDHAVLYRINAQSNSLEQALRRNRVPYRIVSGQSFWDRAEVKDMTAYMTVVLTPGDDLRLLRIINVPARQIGETTIDTVRGLAERESVPMFEILQRSDEFPELQRASLRLRVFANMIEELREQLGSMPLDEFYDLLIERTGYIRALEAKINDKNISRAENVREVKSSILNYLNRDPEGDLAGFLNENALSTELENIEEEDDFVLLMTVHSSKGLEFPTVFLAGMEDGIFPGMRSIGDNSEMEEERRLCYVAITRAKRSLVIIHARQRLLFGQTRAADISRFVEEIPEEHIESIESMATEPEGLPFGNSSNMRSAPRPIRRPEQRSRYSTAGRPAAVSVPEPDYKVGDRVFHRAFGPGVISDMTATGNDYLTVIEFEANGTKRLMLRAAAQHMKKDI